MSYCYSTLRAVAVEGYSQTARKTLAGGGSRVLPHVLPFTHADLALPANERKSRRNSISGVQDKVLLDLVDGAFSIVEKGGDYILKPVPSSPYAQLKEDIPANEHVTMQIASQVFGIETAANGCIRFSDGELAYITRRFDRRDGVPILQEDFCQLSGRTEETHGEDYKYTGSYEEMAEIVRRFCPAAAVELPKLFFRILFDYVFANGDAHLKNFSLYESGLGDYVLTPAYDLLNTQVHFPNEIGRLAMDLFADGDYMTPEYEELGYFTEPDFVRLGSCYGVKEVRVYRMISEFHQKKDKVLDLLSRSFLSEQARTRYREIFIDRLQALRKTAPSVVHLHLKPSSKK